MPGIYTATLPAAPYRPDDIVFASVQSGIPRPDVVNHDAGQVEFVYYTDPGLSAGAVSAWRTLIASNPQPADAPWRVRDTIEQQLGAAMVAMQQIIDAPDLAGGTLTAAQLSNAARAQQTASKAMARLLRRMLRQLRGDLTGSD